MPTYVTTATAAAGRDFCGLIAQKQTSLRRRSRRRACARNYRYLWRRGTRISRERWRRTERDVTLHAAINLSRRRRRVGCHGWSGQAEKRERASEGEWADADGCGRERRSGGANCAGMPTPFSPPPAPLLSLPLSLTLSLSLPLSASFSLPLYPHSLSLSLCLPP